MSRRALAITAIVVIAVSIAIVNAVSGEERSAAAVCKVFREEGGAFRDRLVENNDALRSDPNANLLRGLGELASAPGRAAGVVSEMAAVAPTEVEPAFNTVAEALRKVAETAAENAGNPLGAIAQSVMTQASVQAEWEEVNQYLRTNCEKPA